MKTDMKRRRLVNDAIDAGLTVVEEPNAIFIRRGKTNRSAGIMIWPDGIATRTDVDLELCTAIRSVKDMRAVLRLKKEDQ